ncbi:hypothetical protein [Sorangium sp. So ce1097]|uniref:hypothetical protein n=1 Tax=Sorangium sp. So ce1097 TaxID=3133330 RepID=UPI003F5EBCBA
MSTEFWIQASCPRWQMPRDLEVSTVDEAIEAVFHRGTEDAFVVWRHVYIPLSYKYDVGAILQDVLQMVGELLAADSGEWQVDWPSNTFGARWHFAWAGERLVITASEWRSVVGDTEELLRRRSVLEIGKSEFVFEWKALLERVRDALIGAGYTFDALPELERLVEALRRIVGYGALYR